MDAQRGLDDAAAQALLARLVFVLANHIGDREVMREAIAVAAGSRPATTEPAAPLS